MANGELLIPKTWRSELPRLGVFLVLSIACVILSAVFPGSVIRGKLFSMGDSVVILALPLFWLLPMTALGSALIKIYDVRYSMDSRGIESRVGILSLHQVITRIRFEDIRSIETDQTLVERFLDIGTIEMGTAATAGLEMILSGVSAPTEIQEMIQRERDARIRLAREKEEESAEQGRHDQIIGNV